MLSWGELLCTAARRARNEARGGVAPYMRAPRARNNEGCYVVTPRIVRVYTHAYAPS